MSLLTRTDTMQARLAEAEARIERLEAENARLREAGRKVAAWSHYMGSSDTNHRIWAEAMRVFEEGR